MYRRQNIYIWIYMCVCIEVYVSLYMDRKYRQISIVNKDLKIFEWKSKGKTKEKTLNLLEIVLSLETEISERFTLIDKWVGVKSKWRRRVVFTNTIDLVLEKGV